MTLQMVLRKPQSLRQRLVVQIGLMIVCLVVLSGGAIVGINGLHHDFGDALRGYRQLRAVYEIGTSAASARAALEQETPNIPAAQAALEQALIKFDSGEPIDDPDLRNDLGQARQSLNMAPIESALARLANLSAGIRASIQAKQDAADQKRRVTLAMVMVLGVAVVIAGMMLGIRQYRSIRQLVESERLASVGYLAAGVAHEINNPLGIITGYGERALQQIERQPDSAVERARQALTVMCEEAYRCKRIIDRLLSLARPGTDHRAPVSLRAIVDDVVSGVSALPEYRDRKIVIESEARDEMKILARDGQIKQVFLNLMINALQAVESGNGLVSVTIQRRHDQIEVAVADNGRGMDRPTLDRVFEPFFTRQGGEGQSRGTGLGLSIAHAIVADHGGSISAESAGAGCGSRFVVRLPAYTMTSDKGAAHVNA